MQVGSGNVKHLTFSVVYLVAGKLCLPPAQVVPTCVVDSGNPDKGSDDMGTERTPVQVVVRGVISHWEGLEALLYNTLFQEVCTSLEEAIMCRVL